MMEATLLSIARLAEGPEAVVLAAPKLRAHLFDDAPSDPSRPVRVVTADSADALPLADGFRALAPKVDVIVFVPEGVVLPRATSPRCNRPRSAGPISSAKSA